MSHRLVMDQGRLGAIADIRLRGPAGGSWEACVCVCRTIYRRLGEPWVGCKSWHECKAASGAPASCSKVHMHHAMLLHTALYCVTFPYMYICTCCDMPCCAVTRCAVLCAERPGAPPSPLGALPGLVQICTGEGPEAGSSSQECRQQQQQQRARVVPGRPAAAC